MGTLDLRASMGGRLKTVPRRELLLLGAAAVLGFALRLYYVRATGGHALAGDEQEYNTIGHFLAHGKFMWSDTLYHHAHPTMTKAPLYPVLVGLGYVVFGEHYDRILTIQTLIGPIVIVLTWALARRLFNPRVAIAAAFVVAVYPFAWQFEARLYSEAITTPLVLIALLLFMDREPTRRRIIGLGLTMGLLMLCRPALFYLFAGVLAAWWVKAGARRGLLATAAAALVAALVIVPWTVRNYAEYHAFVPVSWQDAAAVFGTFNDEAAADKNYPFAWRQNDKRDAPLFLTRNAMPEDELRAKLNHNAWEWIKAHPDSLPKAFFWNGLSRFWDIRRPFNVLREVPYEGRSRVLTKIGLAMYWVLLPLALLSLFLLRRRPEVVAPVVAIAVSASIVHTAVSLTRYRAILEPLIVILACAAVAMLLDARRSRRAENASAAVPA
jgi:4-amino-4-deoxy-L-arabinose transferase-like glycosyltransferase